MAFNWHVIYFNNYMKIHIQDMYIIGYTCSILTEATTYLMRYTMKFTVLEGQQRLVVSEKNQFGGLYSTSIHKQSIR